MYYIKWPELFVICLQFCGLPIGLTFVTYWIHEKTKSFKGVIVITGSSLFITVISCILLFVYLIGTGIQGADYGLLGPIGMILTGIFGGLFWTMGNLVVLGIAWSNWRKNQSQN